MEPVANITGFGLSIKSIENRPDEATIFIQGGSIVGQDDEIHGRTLTVRKASTAQRVRVFLSPASGGSLTRTLQGGGVSIIPQVGVSQYKADTDCDQDSKRGVYSDGLIVLGYIEIPEMTNAPNWMHWANLATVFYIDAIWLSLGIEPNQLKREELVQFSAGKSRVEVVESHIGQGTLQTHYNEADRYVERRHGTSLKLTEFRAWGESLPVPFTFPDEFPRTAAPTKSSPESITSATGKDDSIKSRERNNLLRIIRALDAMNPSPLPMTGYAASIEAQLKVLKLAIPSDDTIRKIIEDARALTS